MASTTTLAIWMERSVASARARLSISQGSYRRWHLQHQIHVVWYDHELGQSWPTKYGMVGGVEVNDVEVDVLDVVVASRAELY